MTNRDGSKIFDLEIRGQAKGTLLCAVGGVRDRDAADRLRGTEIFVDRDALPDVEDEEEFYIADLVGMDVRSADTNSIIGRVRAVQDHGAGDIIVLNYKEAGRRDEMFAFTYDIFPDVNVQERYLTFLPPDEVSERDEENELHRHCPHHHAGSVSRRFGPGSQRSSLTKGHLDTAGSQHPRCDNRSSSYRG